MNRIMSVSAYPAEQKKNMFVENILFGQQKNNFKEKSDRRENC